jgi:hypothetical protein
LWWDTIRLLKKEDHYILVMIDRAGLRPRRRSQGLKKQPESVRSIASLMSRYVNESLRASFFGCVSAVLLVAAFHRSAQTPRKLGNTRTLVIPEFRNSLGVDRADVGRLCYEKGGLTSSVNCCDQMA